MPWLSISWMLDQRSVTSHVTGVQYMPPQHDHIFLMLLSLGQFSFRIQVCLVISMYIKLRNIPWEIPPAKSCINTNIYATFTPILQMFLLTTGGNTTTALKFRFISCYCLVPWVKWITNNHHIWVGFKPVSNQLSIQYSLNYWVWRL